MAHDLNLTLIADGQADGQWQSSNDGLTQLANAVGDNLAVDFTAGNVTLTAAQFRSALRFTPTGLAANRSLTIAAVKRPFFLVDNTDATYSITVTKGSTTIAVAPGYIGFLNTDGTTNSLTGAVFKRGVAAAESYDFAMPYFAGQPTSSQILARIPIVTAITIPANMVGSVGFTPAANPTASFAMDVQDDGGSIGTVTISTGGAYSFATTSGTAKAVAAGSLITVVAPVTPDATVDGIQFGIKATET
ncbi:hypothetical protein [Mesorhizobium sp.]|uniref:hypothetical protein n=1 Tax=Mesorhizobium sp. TaxID=1871066 RepID=UPI0011F71095|nr:hypothetical protein [Mesorhizobium sp.]TIN78349.1 MAG: hypothetical protein E5Y09_13260 [Mesorhizobium sp.]